MDATNIDAVKCKSADSTILESALESLFPHDNGLNESARYAVFSGGKRIRPRLVLATTETYGIPSEQALIPACALELIHSYSLIHDDLPCMDNDDYRRGKPTLHKAYPEWHALLTGDFLLTYAFELLSDAPYLSSDQKIALIRTLSCRAGQTGILGGQFLDLTFANSGPLLVPAHERVCENLDSDFSARQSAELDGNLKKSCRERAQSRTGKDEPKNRKEFRGQARAQMHLQKTASLIIAALEFGGIIANSPDLELLRDIGSDLGLAYQLIDDLIDGEAAEADRALAKAHYDKAVQNIHALSKPAPLLEDLAQALVFRSH